MYRPCLLFLALFFIPQVSHAKVIISEVAWLGTPESANHEWIELHNTNDNHVSLSSWKLTITPSDGAEKTITLPDDVGNIDRGAYAVLERTSEKSAPGTAFHIYTGALPNNGATLTLKDATNSVVDSVSWNDKTRVNYDKNSGVTLQYIGNKWTVAPATPGRAPKEIATQPAPDPDTPPIATQPATTGAGVARRDTTQVPTAPHVMSLALPRVGFVGETISFTTKHRGGTKWERGGQTLTWNFGDGYTSTKRQPTHHYQYPGTYIVTVARLDDGELTALQHEITIVPVALALTRATDGAVQITNQADHNIALDGMRIASLTTHYNFPEHTTLKAGSTITLSPELFSTSPRALLVMYDQRKTVVAHTFPNQTKATTRTTPQTAVAQTITAQPVLVTPVHKTPTATLSPAPTLAHQATTSSTKLEAETPPTVPLTTSPTVTTVDAIATTRPTTTTSTRLIWYGLAGLLMVAVFGLVLRLRRRRGQLPW